jgi:hypothetical protein
MDYLPSVVSAKYIRDFIVEIQFDDGTIKSIDCKPWLKGEVFEPLKETEYFQKFFLEGGSIAWPNGADIAPEALYAAEMVSKYR